MPPKDGVYIIECVPEEKEKREGIILYEFLRMILPRDRIDFSPVRNFNGFRNAVVNNNYNVIHISCEGVEDEGELCIHLPVGKPVHSDEFCETSHLKGRYMVITGCELGRGEFAKKLKERTHAKTIIAPKKTIPFEDSAMWCVNFYYYHLLTGKSFAESYDYMNKKFHPQVMKIW
ncbi:MAG: hypothetical protein OIN90_11290 [Candidatus Methanoperedens sp.]|nr:hypothetical protein [Candidatus Methanoperedens sp.]